MNKTLEQWAEDFNKKTPEKFVRDERYELFYLPDKGFCEIGVTEKMLIIHQLSGDGRFWKNFAEKLARLMNLKVCGTWCIRKEILAYIRLFGYKIIEVEEFSPKYKIYHCEDSTGRKARVAPAFYYKNVKVQAYYATWEV